MKTPIRSRRSRSKNLTIRQVFAKVREHLLAQNKQSFGNSPRNAGVCAYRGQDGLSCAVGCLIADEHYDDSFEGYVLHVTDEASPFQRLAVRRLRRALSRSGVPVSAPKVMDLLVDLQNLHDQHDPCIWPALLRDLEARYLSA